MTNEQAERLAELRADVAVHDAHGDLDGIAKLHPRAVALAGEVVAGTSNAADMAEAVMDFVTADDGRRLRAAAVALLLLPAREVPE